MKQKLLAGIMLAATSLCASPAVAQVANEDLRLALDILKGKDKSHDKAWAVHLLEEVVADTADARVLNTLAVAYLHGIGTEADTARAVSCFEQSGEAGHALAYHNLGMYYKYDRTGHQDFYKAYEAFAKGAQMGSPTNQYNCGFMLYKGLGCGQDYAAAVEYFRQSAANDHKYSLFMLGLCYRNGYGVEADTVVANDYLRRSAALGLRDAMEELLNEEPENSDNRTHYAVLDDAVAAPDEMPDVVPYLPANNRTLAGRYEGLLVTYDWSGQHVISEKPLWVDMQVADSIASGLWVQGVDSIPFVARISADGHLRFDSTEADLYDRYASDFTTRYRFEQAEMSFDGTCLTGRLRLYALAEMEPERPMYVSLFKDGESVEGSDADDGRWTRLYAHSVPNSDQVILKFELAEDVPSVSVAFYTQLGNNVLNYSYGALEAGEQTLVLHPALSDGYYAIRVVAGNQRLETMIVK